MIEWLILVAAVVSTPPEGEKERVRVLGDNTVAYETPSPNSPALRRLYPGELVEVISTVISDGVAWAEIRLGASRSAFVPATELATGAEQIPTAWEREPAVRDQRPLAVLLKGYAETLGAGLSARYQPFTRIGANITFGTVIEKGRPRGTTLSGGVNVFVVLWNFTPVIEAGWAVLAYEKGGSRLRMNAIYTTLGLEWVFDWGGLISVHGTYLRSVDIEVASPYGRAPPTDESYGILDPGDRQWVQMLTPGVSLGYAF